MSMSLFSLGRHDIVAPCGSKICSSFQNYTFGQFLPMNKTFRKCFPLYSWKSSSAPYEL
jgi:hypothetical protein